MIRLNLRLREQSIAVAIMFVLMINIRIPFYVVFNKKISTS